jgi:DNA-binding LacI/PurR family transcriptional regulator
LNNEHGVSDELRRKTLNFIEKKGYRPRPSAKRGTRLGVVMQNERPTFDGFYSQVLTGIFRYASEEGIETTLIHHLPERGGGMSLAECLRRKRCNGSVILVSGEEGPESLVESRIPTVYVANRCEVKEVGFIDCDSYAGALEQMHYLIRLGHHKIAFLQGQQEGFVDHQERLAAYRHAMRTSGLSIEPGWVVEDEPGLTEQMGYNQARRLLVGYPEVTAIFANNDLQARGAICACVEAERCVPEDISVVGFDDNPSSRFNNPPLTTVRQPLEEMGYESAKWVDRKLKGRITELPRKVMPTELIVRRSCAPVARETVGLSNKKPDFSV